MLVAFASAELHRENGRANLLGALVNQTAKDRILPDLIEEYPHDRLRSLGLGEPDGLLGLPDIGRGRGGDYENDIR